MWGTKEKSSLIKKSKEFMDSDRAHPSNFNKLPSIPFGQSRCKIACTLGPNSDHYIKDLFVHGMSIARIDFSLGEREDHRRCIAAVRRISYNTKRLCAIMVATSVLSLSIGPLIKASLDLEQGAVLKLTTRTERGDQSEVSVTSLQHTYKRIPKGTIIHIGDTCSLRINTIGDGFLSGIVQQDCQLSEGMSVTFDDLDLYQKLMSLQAAEDIQIAAELGVDFLSVSNVTSADCIRQVRSILGEYSEIRVFAKVPSTGLDKIDEIIDEVDGICFLRSSLENIGTVHREICEKCNRAGKTIITGSQLCASSDHPNPIIIQAQQIEKAVDHGTDVFMLCNETSSGKNPVRAIATLSAILTERESKLKYVEMYKTIFLHSWKASAIFKNDLESIASSAVKTAFEIDASLILVLTQTNAMARAVAKYRPACSIMCITDNQSVARQCLCLRSTFPLLVGSISGTESLIGRAVEVARDVLNICEMGDKIVVAASVKGIGEQEEKIVRVKIINF